MYKNLLLNKNFTYETTDMNEQLFQTIKESRDATQYVKSVEALERYTLKNYTVNLTPLFQRDEQQMPVIDIPKKATDDEINKTPNKTDIYQLKLKKYIKEERLLKVALKSIWAVIWGQCSTSIWTKVEKRKDIKELKRKANVVELLKYIQQACMKYKDKHHPCVTLCQQFSAFRFYYQMDGLPIQKYLQVFKIMVVNIEHYGGELGNSSAIILYVL